MAINQFLALFGSIGASPAEVSPKNMTLNQNEATSDFYSLLSSMLGSQGSSLASNQNQIGQNHSFFQGNQQNSLFPEMKSALNFSLNGNNTNAVSFVAAQTLIQSQINQGLELSPEQMDFLQNQPGMLETAEQEFLSSRPFFQALYQTGTTPSDSTESNGFQEFMDFLEDLANNPELNEEQKQVLAELMQMLQQNFVSPEQALNSDYSNSANFVEEYESIEPVTETSESDTSETQDSISQKIKDKITQFFRIFNLSSENKEFNPAQIMANVLPENPKTEDGEQTDQFLKIPDKMKMPGSENPTESIDSGGRSSEDFFINKSNQVTRSQSVKIESTSNRDLNFNEIQFENQNSQSTTANIAKELAETIKAAQQNGRQTLQIQIPQESSGLVKVAISESGNEIKMTIETDQPQVKSYFESNTEQIQKLMADYGLDLKQIETHLETKSDSKTLLNALRNVPGEQFFHSGLNKAEFAENQPVKIQNTSENSDLPKSNSGSEIAPEPEVQKFPDLKLVKDIDAKSVSLDKGDESVKIRNMANEIVHSVKAAQENGDTKIEIQSGNEKVTIQFSEKENVIFLSQSVDNSGNDKFIKTNFRQLQDAMQKLGYQLENSENQVQNENSIDFAKTLKIHEKPEIATANSSVEKTQLIEEPKTDFQKSTNQEISKHIDRNTVERPDSPIIDVEKAAKTSAEIAGKDDTNKVSEKAIKNMMTLKQDAAKENSDQSPQTKSMQNQPKQDSVEKTATEFSNSKLKEATTQSDIRTTAAEKENVVSDEAQLEAPEKESNDLKSAIEASKFEGGSKENRNEHFSGMQNHDRAIRTASGKAVDREALPWEKLTETLKLEKIAEQMANHVKVAMRDGKSEMTLQLKPESLGQMSLKLLVEENIINLKISVDNSDTKQMIETNFTHLQKTLADQGLKFDRFEVTLKQDNPGFSENLYHSSQENSQQKSGWEQQRNRFDFKEIEKEDVPVKEPKIKPRKSDKIVEIIA